MYNALLDTFVCVADCGSFSKAAEKLFISPTAVMKQMNLLEEHLDLQLIHRTHHGIRLTPMGESIYKDAKAIIQQSETAIMRAKLLSEAANYTICVGTSMLNPCKVFMDLWYQINDQFPRFKIHIIPFEDDHNGILSVINKIGEQFDFIVGVCDSAQWLSRCRFFQLGTYQKCVAVPIGHPLATKKKLKLSDLYGQTLMMVKRGDSPLNDHLRDDLERNHPQIRIEDTDHFYDISVFNRCVQEGNVLLNIECWKDIHPSLVTIPVEWDYTIPYGLLYALSPPEDILQFLEAIRTLCKAD
ncbi:MAG: LysR family transcriptional regulator [Oscillospiraceae bacterium]